MHILSTNDIYIYIYILKKENTIKYLEILEKARNTSKTNLIVNLSIVKDI